MLEKNTTQKFWDQPKAGELYNRQFTNMIGWYTNETETQPLVDLTQNFKGKKILDVGCGTGRHLTLFDRSNKLCGIDQSPEMLSVAQQANPTATLQVSSAEALPFESNTFDLVYSIRVLQHIRNQKQAVKEMIRVCKPGGMIIIANYNSWSLLNVYKHLRMSWIGKLLNVPFKFILKERSFFGPWGFFYDDYSSIFDLKNILANNNVEIKHCWGLSCAVPWFFSNFFLGKIFEITIPNFFRWFLKFCLFLDRFVARHVPFKYFTDLILVAGSKTQ